MKKEFIFLCLLFIGGASFSQYTLIPDTEFENWLIYLNIDSEGTLDGQVLTSDIENVTLLSMNPGFPNPDYYVEDLTGIEDFSNLETLNIAGNLISIIDLSNNVMLKSLNCKENNLSALNLSNNQLLEVLDAANCFPGTCNQENTFSSIDLSANSNLKQLFITNNNTLTTINLENNGQLFNVSLSRNSSLEEILIANQNNTSLEFFNAIDVPSLTCIQVDDPALAAAADTFPYDQWNIQDGVLFSDDCSLGVQEYLDKQITVFPNPVTNVLEIGASNTIQLELFTLYDILGRKVHTQQPEMLMNFSQLSVGYYTLAIDTNRGRLIKKIIKE